MSRYEYQARNKEGKKISGIIDGQNESAIAAELIRNGTVPIAIYLHVPSEKSKGTIDVLFRLESPGVEDLSFLCRQLYSLFKAGVPIVRAVQVVTESAKNFKLKRALSDILVLLEEGQALSVGMRHHPDIFPTLMVALVNVGENTGSLDAVFKQISVHFEREARTKKQIANAIRYPMVVLSVISVAIGVINLLVVPAFAKFFHQFHSELPLPTRLLIACSDFFVNDWYFLLGGIIVLILGFRFLINTKKGRYMWDKNKLSFPIIGDIINRALLARFSRSFALCTRTGVPLLESVQMIAKTTDNVYVSEKIISMRTYIEHGESLTNAATKSEMFTLLVLQMLSIGEETGDIDKLLDEVADYYEQEVDYEVERLGDAIEPILICIIAGLVLVLALGVFLPMWDLWQVALGK
jgi:MSHA biogenesis protein MshG